MKVIIITTFLMLSSAAPRCADWPATVTLTDEKKPEANECISPLLGRTVQIYIPEASITYEITEKQGDETNQERYERLVLESAKAIYRLGKALHNYEAYVSSTNKIQRSTETISSDILTVD
jgi:hypothetical protein